MTDPRPVTVRPARPEDAAAMQELAAAAYRPYVSRMGRQPAPMTADYTEITSARTAWVAEQGRDLVGLIVVELAEDHLMLDNVAVAPDVQGGGVGSRLLQVAEEHARAQGLREVRLYTNEAMAENLEYYSRRGYREIHRGVQDGFRRIFFTKTLDRGGNQETPPRVDRPRDR